MKKAKHNVGFKLCSLVLSAALIFAVAAVSPLTSVAETNYVMNNLYDFEDDSLSVSGSWSIVDSTAVGGTGKALYMSGNTENQTCMLDEIALQKDHTYIISFKYYNVAYEWTRLAYWKASDKSWGDTFGPDLNSTNGAWRTLYAIYTPSEEDIYLGFIGQANIYIDDLRVIDKASVSTANGLFASTDGVIDCTNEYPIVSNSSKFSYVSDPTYGTVLETTLSSNPNGNTQNTVAVPVNLKNGKKYRLSFNYITTANAVESDANPYYCAVFAAGSSMSSTDYVSDINSTATSWQRCIKDFTAEKDYSLIYIFATRKDGGTTDIKLANFSIVEVNANTGNTEKKQTYDFTKNTFSAIETYNNNYSFAVQKNGLLMDNAVSFYPDKTGEYNVQLDYPLTAGNTYRISYSYRGTSNFRLLPNTGKWDDNIYGSEFYRGNDDISLSSDKWVKRELVFTAKNNSTHIFARADQQGKEAFYIDNIVLEDITDNTKDIAFADFDNCEVGVGINGYLITTAPNNSNNRVLTNTSEDYSIYCFNDMLLKRGRTYSVSFDYSSTGVFRFDYIQASDKTTKEIWWGENSNGANTSSAFVLQPEEDSYFGFLSGTKYGKIYVDNIRIVDITEQYNAQDFDSADASIPLYASNGRISVGTTNDSEKGEVLSLTFKSGTTYSSASAYVPFKLENNETYIISLTYKSDGAFAYGCCKETGGNYRLSGGAVFKTSQNWITEKRYVTGADIMTVFACDAASGEVNAMISEIKITKAGSDADLNGDGITDITDVKLLRERLFLGARAGEANEEVLFEKYTDQNGDGLVDIRDLVAFNNKRS